MGKKRLLRELIQGAGRSCDLIQSEVIILETEVYLEIVKEHDSHLLAVLGGFFHQYGKPELFVDNESITGHNVFAKMIVGQNLDSDALTAR